MKIAIRKKEAGSKKRHMLKDITVTEVSSVGRGANQGATVTLLKTADGDVLKRSFNEALSDMGISEKLMELMGEMFKMNRALRASLHSILESPDIRDKKAAIRESIAQFAQAMESVISDTDVIKEIRKALKTEQGKKFPAGDYAYAPDPDKSSTWKLRLTSEPGGAPDPRIVGMAVAALGAGFRGQKVQIPSEDRAKVVARVRAAWLKANKDKGEKDLPAVLKKSEEEETMDKEAMDKLQKTVEGLQGKLAKSEFLASLNDAEKAHYNGLGDEDRAAFEKMDADARKTAVDAAIAKKAAGDETFESEGVTISKSEVGPGVFAFMKAQQAKTDAAVAKAEKLEADAVQKSLEAEAEKLFPNMAGTAADKAAMLKGIRALPKDQQETQITMLKAADEAMAKSFKEAGQGGTTDGDSPAEKLTKMAKTHAESNKVSFEKAYAAVLETKEGQELYDASLTK